MGLYLNPGNEGFRSIRKKDYVDKSGLIGIVNQTINSAQKLTCISRPRRFGKSFAAQMLSAYYDKSCDSKDLFDDLAISGDPSYRLYLNQFDVIYLDMTNVMEEAGGAENVVPFIRKQLTGELKKAYPMLEISEAFTGTLLKAEELADNRLIVIIDEWDAIFREAREDRKTQEKYVNFLRSLFKSSGTTDRIFSAVYMTGILPIKKYGTQSAMSDFLEFTMIQPGEFGQYVGFTEEEVLQLCQSHDIDFEQMKKWYDGYAFRDVPSVYNPNSVMSALRFREFGSYWSRSGTYDTLSGYIDMDFDGLQQDIIQMLGGAHVAVNTRTFQNDMVTIRSKDDVLTLLVHLGYLAYNGDSQTVRIPNEEIRLEFKDAVASGKRKEKWRPDSLT